MANLPEAGVFGPNPSREMTTVIDEDKNIFEVPVDQAWEYDGAMHYTPTEEGEQ